VDGEFGESVSDLLIRNPTLVVGIGGAGSRISRQAAGNLECRKLLVSSDRKDLGDSETSILVESGGWINPSTYKLRSFAQGQRSEILTALEGYSTIVLISNLAGRSGCAMAPVISSLAKEFGATVICVAIMPFKFEKDRLFMAGIAFRRLRETCDSVIVMDNDAFLDNNPELNQEECFSLTNKAIIDVLASITSGGIKREVNVLCTSKSAADSESSLRDSVAMLYHDVPNPEAIRRTMLYVMGGERVPVGELNKMVGNMQGMFKVDSSTEVAMASVSASDGVQVHLVASMQQGTRFDRYDPLGDIFPKESVLDWEEPESGADISLPIPAME
jgi:cell division protein FtsZ